MLLVFTVQQYESALPMHIVPPIFQLPSHSAHHSVLSRGLCAIQWVLISYLFYM